MAKSGFFLLPSHKIKCYPHFAEVFQKHLWSGNAQKEIGDFFSKEKSSNASSFLTSGTAFILKERYDGLQIWYVPLKSPGQDPILDF